MKKFKELIFKVLYFPPIFKTLKALVFPLYYPRVAICKYNYIRTLRRIRSRAKGRKLRVLFLVGEPAKWKCQLLYEKMAASDDFEPVVGLTAWNTQSAYFCTEEQLEERHREAEMFFDRLGDRCVRTYKNFPRRGIKLAKFNPDVVFYSEPWLPIKMQTPERTSATSICCFVPYFVPSTGATSIICEEDVHRFCHTYFTLSDSWSEYYARKLGCIRNVQQFVGTGLPALDYFAMGAGQISEKTVIYAPHHSIPNPQNTIPWNISTFDWSGRAVLDYAKNHPEFRWVFKPHPLLKNEVVSAGFMTQVEIDSYFDEWARFATVCLDGDYQKMFIESFAMITDCGSFLSEYGATGKPLIRLVRTTKRSFPPLPTNLLESYYQVRNLDEMYAAFRLVLEEGKDPKKDERQIAERKAGLTDSHASDNIMAYLRRLLK